MKASCGLDLIHGLPVEPAELISIFSIAYSMLDVEVYLI